jgi:hypothetical protein
LHAHAEGVGAAKVEGVPVYAARTQDGRYFGSALDRGGLVEPVIRGVGVVLAVAAEALARGNIAVFDIETVAVGGTGRWDAELATADRFISAVSVGLAALDNARESLAAVFAALADSAVRVAGAFLHALSDVGTGADPAELAFGAVRALGPASVSTLADVGAVVGAAAFDVVTARAWNAPVGDVVADLGRGGARIDLGVTVEQRFANAGARVARLTGSTTTRGAALADGAAFLGDGVAFLTFGARVPGERAVELDRDLTFAGLLVASLVLRAANHGATGRQITGAVEQEACEEGEQAREKTVVMAPHHGANCTRSVEWIDSFEPCMVECDRPRHY